MPDLSEAPGTEYIPPTDEQANTVTMSIPIPDPVITQTATAGSVNPPQTTHADGAVTTQTLPDSQSLGAQPVVNPIPQPSSTIEVGDTRTQTPPDLTEGTKPSSVSPPPAEETKGQLEGYEEIKQQLAAITLTERFSEKALEDYVYKNVSELWKRIFAEDVESYERQKQEVVNAIERKTGEYIPKKGIIADLVVTCKSGKTYLVEVKNGTDPRQDYMFAIGQLLYYSIMFNAERLVIFTTRHDPAITEVIKKYDLPLDILLFGKEGVYLLNKYE